MTRQRLARLLLAAITCAVTTLAAHAQTWPARPMRLIVPATAGGPFDTMARLIGERLSKNLGQPVVTENIAGLGGMLGAAALAKAAPDGHSFGLNALPLSINQSLLREPPIDARRDLAPVVQLTWGYNVLVVHPSVPVTSVAQLVAHLKANPGKLNFASGGVGTPAHISAELFRRETSTDMVHVPFKSAAPAIQEVLAGRVQLMFGIVQGLSPHIRSGALRALAVVGPKRLANFPDLPSMSEAGYARVDVRDWQGIFMPAATPRDIVLRMNREINAILADPEVRERLMATGVDVVGGAPEELGRLLAADVERWGQLIRAAGIKSD
ncbi:MAG: Bug family tripartite tricarboxylate transporter substrate binding protein [Burkholderiales bacterium]